MPETESPIEDDRERIVEAAVRLFYKRGFHATSLDDIKEQAGVDEPTLAQHFESKDALVLAALERRDHHFRELLQSEVAARGETATERLLSVFDVLSDWYEGPGFHGCMFINATVEFSEREGPINQAAGRHKAALYDYLRELTVATGIPHATEVSEQLVLLMEGAIVTTQVTGKPHVARQARVAAEVLLSRSG